MCSLAALKKCRYFFHAQVGGIPEVRPLFDRQFGSLLPKFLEVSCRAVFRVFLAIARIAPLAKKVGPVVTQLHFIGQGEEFCNSRVQFGREFCWKSMVSYGDKTNLLIGRTELFDKGTLACSIELFEG